MVNQHPPIQQLCIRLAGFFEYNITAADKGLIEGKFAYDNYYENSKDYFKGKYYPNWLKTLYPQKEELKKTSFPFLDGNHLIFKDTAAIGVQQIAVNGTMYTFTINSIDVYLFRENYALFSIDVSPESQHCNFNDIAGFVNAARHTRGTPIITLMEENVLSTFRGSNKWHSYNPNLKLFLNADVATNFNDTNDLNHLLFELATASAIGSSYPGHLYSPSSAYYSKIIDHNTIDVFNNWKTICLSDSLVRVSVNLKAEDHHRLWDNDYYAIYVFILFIRFYLYRTSESLSNNFNGEQTGHIKESYLQFMNEFDLAQISYKFLPNEIYKKMLSSLEVTDELKKLDEKIDRIDKFKKEIHEQRLKNVERYFLVASIALVSWEGSELLNLFLYGPENHHHHRFIASVLFVIVLTLALFIYYLPKKKKSSVLN